MFLHFKLKFLLRKTSFFDKHINPFPDWENCCRHFTNYYGISLKLSSWLEKILAYWAGYFYG